MATLETLAEAFVAGGGRRRAEQAAAALDLGLDAGQVARLRLALRLVESPLANLLLTGRGVRLGELAEAERERYLVAWSRSRLGPRRSAFQAFRRLLSFLAYADPLAPDGSAPNPRLAAIGYPPDRPPVAAAPASVDAVDGADQPADADGLVNLRADVVVVGSGAGGGVVAAELAHAGRSVVVVEAGQFVPEPAMPRNELDAFDQLYLDHGLTATSDGAITILAGAAVGGGTLVNWMTCVAPPAEAREAWRSHGLDSLDATFDADVRAIEEELGVGPPATIPPKDASLLAGAAALGWAAAPVRRNAIDCADCGSCPFGCVRGTKRSGIRAHLESATAAGARVVARAAVERVVIEAGRAVGVEAALPDGRRLTVRSRTVVMAAGALRTPGILARSGIDHPAIGRHLRLHPVPVVAGLFDEPIDMWRGTMQAVRVDAFIAGDVRRHGYVIESAPGHPGLVALALPWEGRAAHAALMDRIRWIAPYIAVTRDGGGGRVTATRSGRTLVDYRLDRLGVATLRHALASMADIARAAGAASVIAAGTPELRWDAARTRPDGGVGLRAGAAGRAYAAFRERLLGADFGSNRMAVFSAHQMGTVRMGADPLDHPADPEGRVRTDRKGRLVEGLWVADASLFPTAIGVNPMITVMALARRVARAVGDGGAP